MLNRVWKTQHSNLTFYLRSFDPFKTLIKMMKNSKYIINGTTSVASSVDRFFCLSTKRRTGTVNWIKVSQLDASSSNVLLSWNPIQWWNILTCTAGDTERLKRPCTSALSTYRFSSRSRKKITFRSKKPRLSRTEITVRSPARMTY